jgi:ADP-ribosyl-[dinitrogen reductase] hydrolase
MTDTADVVAELRAEGHKVLVHCVRAEQRTPSVAVAYGMRLGATPGQARAMIAQALPEGRRSGRLWDSADG